MTTSLTSFLSQILPADTTVVIVIDNHSIQPTQKRELQYSPQLYRPCCEVALSRWSSANSCEACGPKNVNTLQRPSRRSSFTGGNPAQVTPTSPRRTQFCELGPRLPSRRSSIEFKKPTMKDTATPHRPLDRSAEREDGFYKIDDFQQISLNSLTLLGARSA